MARPLNPQRKAAVMQAALELFAVRGVSNTSTAEIARQAGVAAGTLFLYFPTRQDLLDALALQIGAQQSARIRSLLEPARSARQQFWTIWDGSLAWFQENPLAYQYLQQVRDSGLISPAAVEQSGQFFTYYFAAIQQGFAEGCLKPCSPALIGEMLYQDIVAVMNQLRREADPEQRAALIVQGFDIFWDGVRLQPGSDPHKEERP